MVLHLVKQLMVQTDPEELAVVQPIRNIDIPCYPKR